MSLTAFFYLTLTAIHVLMAWSIYLPYRVRRLHFMTVANMAASAYLGGYAATAWGWPLALVLPLGALLGCGTAVIVAPAIGDAPPFTVAIVGLTLISLTKVVIENTPALGGTLGMFGIPSILPDPGRSRVLLLLVTWGFVALVGYLIARFERSRHGIAASTAFIDRDLAESNAVDVRRLGIVLQIAGSTIAGAAGVLYAFTMRGLFPDFFTFRYVGILMTILFVGGHSVPWGVLLAAPLIWGIPLLLPESVQSWRIVIYAAILVLVVTIRPEGIVTREVVRNVSSLLHRRLGGGR